MARAPLMNWVAGASMVAAATGAVGCAATGQSPAAPEAFDLPSLDTRQVVVYFDDHKVTSETLAADLAREFGVARVVRVLERKLATGGVKRLSALVLGLRADRQSMSSGEWRVWKQSVESRAGVSGVERHQRRALRGAPRDYTWTPAMVQSADIAGQDAMQDVNLDSASSSATGAGVRVAVLDTGFDTSHEAISDALVAGRDTLDDDGDVTDYGNGIDDDSDGHVDLGVGHGTFVASLIHAAAPDAEIIPIRVLDDEGHGTNLALWTGITEALDRGADVINMSLVASSIPQPLKDAIDDAVDAGVTIVVSAGNDPLGPLNHAYLCDRAIVVGGCDSGLSLLSWSPTGASVDIYAPADDVLGAIGGTGSQANSYGTWDGTSFAAAFVSAAVALTKELHPGFDGDDMEAHLMAGADTVLGALPVTRGQVDLLDAVN